MADEKKAVKEEEKPAAASQDDSSKKVKASGDEPGDDIDWGAEAAALLDKNKQLENDRDNYRDGMLAAKGKKGKSDDAADDEGEPMVPLSEVDKIVDKKLSQFNTSAASATIDALLASKISDPKQREVVRWHYENSTNGGDIAERIDNAIAIANKKRINKTVSEIELARQNKANRSSGQGGGGSGESTPADERWSKEQLEHFAERAKAVGIPVEKYKEQVWNNYQKSLKQNQ